MTYIFQGLGMRQGYGKSARFPGTSIGHSHATCGSGMVMELVYTCHQRRLEPEARRFL